VRRRDRHAPTDPLRRQFRKGNMSTVSQMLDAYPKDLGGINEVSLVACIEACQSCSQSCSACADSCLSEDSVSDLTRCVRTNLDCADLCEVTARVLSRHTGYDAKITRSVLETCAAMCKACGDECTKHAGHHEHCRVCADACRRCEQACRELIGSLG